MIEMMMKWWPSLTITQNNLITFFLGFSCYNKYVLQTQLEQPKQNKNKESRVKSPTKTNPDRHNGEVTETSELLLILKELL